MRRRALLLGLALVVGCSGAPPSGAAPTPASSLPTLPAPTSSAGAGASAAVAPAPPNPCAPSAPRTVTAPSRAGSSLAIAEARGRKLVYVADADDRAIHTLDAAGPSELAVTPLPGRPEQVLPLADGRILVTLRDRNRLLVLEPAESPEAPLVTRCERPTYTEPFGLAVSVDGATVALTTGWDHRLMLLDAKTLSPARVVDLPAEPRGVLLSGDGDTAYVSHLAGGRMSIVSLSRPAEAPRTVFTRPERPKPKEAEKVKPAKASKEKAKAPKTPDKMQELAAAQGFALAEMSLGKTGDKPWPARVFVPMASSDPMQFGAVSSFPGVYGGAGGPAVIGAFVAVIDPAAASPLGGEVAPIRVARPEDCILPRGIATYGDRILLACMGIDQIVELDARAADPTSAERRRFLVAEGPTGVVVDEPTQRAFVFSQHAVALDVLDLSGKYGGYAKMLKLARPAAPALSPQLARGRQLFYVTRDVRTSFDGRACASCHPDGRADGLTWATPDGPRQPILLAGRLAGSGPYGWFGDHPVLKNHVLFTVSRLGGLGFHSPEDEADLDALLAYIGQISLPSREGALVDAGVEGQRSRGRELFESKEVGCSGCHAGGGTDGQRHDVGSGDVIEKRVAFDTPTLRGVAGSAPFFHDGRYATLMDLLADPKSKMGRSAELLEADRRALAAYLESL